MQIYAGGIGVFFLTLVIRKKNSTSSFAYDLHNVSSPFSHSFSHTHTKVKKSDASSWG